jgi:hypothetical protein
LRRSAAAALALWLAFATLGVWAQVVPTQPEAKSFKLGAFEISVLRDGALEFPNDGAVFGVNAGQRRWQRPFATLARGQTGFDSTSIHF